MLLLAFRTLLTEADRSNEQRCEMYNSGDIEHQDGGCMLYAGVMKSESNLQGDALQQQQVCVSVISRCNCNSC